MMKKTAKLQNSSCAYKTITYSLYVPLHWDEILMQGRISKTITESLFLTFYLYVECEFAALMLYISYDCDKIFYYHKHVVHKIRLKLEKS